MQEELIDSAKQSAARREFSLPLYVLIVFGISWPFQFFIYFWPGSAWASKMLLVSMIMVGVGTLVAAKCVFHDNLADAGWHWGRHLYLLAAFLLPVVVWVVPTSLGIVLGLQVIPASFDWIDTVAMFLTSFVVTLAPAFGEELGWRGYLYPRLLANHSARRALVIQGLVWWAWHLPVLVHAGVFTPVVEMNIALSVSVVLAVSIIPSVMHAVVFAWFWSASSSLVVTTLYHAAFDEVRDTVAYSLGSGPLVQPWQMLVLTSLGCFLLWKGKWALPTQRVPNLAA